MRISRQVGTQSKRKQDLETKGEILKNAKRPCSQGIVEDNVVLLMRGHIAVGKWVTP